MYKIDDYHRSEIILKPTWGDFDRKIAVSFTCYISKEALLEALVFWKLTFSFCLAEYCKYNLMDLWKWYKIQ